MTTSPVVGVDVAKDRLDVAIRSSDETWSTANDEAGVAAAHHNPVIRVFCRRLRAAGKPAKVALTACMG